MVGDDVEVVVSDGVCLRVRVDGPEDGALVVLLHGFPEGAYGWRHQVPSLAAAGYEAQPLHPLLPDPREMARPSIDQCDDGHLVVIERATHWVQHEEAERVNALIEAFARGGTAALAGREGN